MRAHLWPCIRTYLEFGQGYVIGDSRFYGKDSLLSCACSPQAEGHWCLQDKKASDPIENAMSVMQINPLLKIAMRQLKGIELKQTDKQLVLVLRSRFSWFRVSNASYVSFCFSTPVMLCSSSYVCTVMIHMTHLCVTHLCVTHLCVTQIQLHEHYPISCQPVHVRRRDFRSGKQSHIGNCVSA